MFMPVITIPAFDIYVPDELEQGQHEYVGGQVAITGVIHALGDQETQPGNVAVPTELILRSLSMALAMMICADSRNTTPQAVRKEGERLGKAIAGYGKILKEADDQIGAHLLQALNLVQQEAKLN